MSALAESARNPRLDYPKLRVARFSRVALAAGVEQRRMKGVRIRVYSAAKTVGDCFKYRNKVGIDVASKRFAISRASTAAAPMNLRAMPGSAGSRG